MTAKSKYERVIDARSVQFFLSLQRSECSIVSFEEVEKLIISNGGRVVDLDEPKLTHVVIDKRDDSRRLELMRRTAKYVATFCLLPDKYLSLWHQSQAETEVFDPFELHTKLFGRSDASSRRR